MVFEKSTKKISKFIYNIFIKKLAKNVEIMVFEKNLYSPFIVFEIIHN